MRKCDCYRTKEKYTSYDPFILNKTVVGYCVGTKEQDECSCGGDKLKCDFYPEVREKALNEQENNITENNDDCLIVAYDNHASDVPTLCIARREKDRVRVLNTIQGDQAFGMYYYLTGNAELKEKEIKANADKIRSMNDEELAKCLVNIGWDCHLCSECEKLSDSPLLKDERCDECCVEHCLEWLQKDVKRY